ncbi:MAG: VacJ family lipoprotein [Pseudomonadota bacterium]|nr:VacJ family lipoprotein [Pseudomonadota bacterium]
MQAFLSGFAHRITRLFLVPLLVLSVSACATTAGNSAGGGEIREMGDPLEPLNRTIFGINEFLDIFIVGPFAAVYRTVLPDLVQDAVRDFLRNLESPIVIANQLLQGDWEGAGNAAGRLGVNSTIGVLGLFDAADPLFSLPYEKEDFGQTLATWGADDGFYLVLPLLGPSNLRDTFGLVVDSFADPLNMYARNTDRLWISVTRGTARGIDTRARLNSVVEDVRMNSLDPYATYRNMYKQSRENDIADGNVQQPDIP